MILACREIIPPKEWHHSPELKSDYDDTVAMYLASHEIIPPKEWIHRPEL